MPCYKDNDGQNEGDEIETLGRLYSERSKLIKRSSY